MKISKIKNKKVDKPFYQDKKISIVFKTDRHKITGMECFNGKRYKLIKVKNDNILNAWKLVEKFFAKI